MPPASARLSLRPLRHRALPLRSVLSLRPRSGTFDVELRDICRKERLANHRIVGSEKSGRPCNATNQRSQPISLRKQAAAMPLCDIAETFSDRSLQDRRESPPVQHRGSSDRRGRGSMKGTLVSRSNKESSAASGINACKRLRVIRRTHRRCAQSFTQLRIFDFRQKSMRQSAYTLHEVCIAAAVGNCIAAAPPMTSASGWPHVQTSPPRGRSPDRRRRWPAIPAPRLANGLQLESTKFAAPLWRLSPLWRGWEAADQNKAHIFLEAHHETWRSQASRRPNVRTSRGE